MKKLCSFLASILFLGSSLCVFASDENVNAISISAAENNGYVTVQISSDFESSGIQGVLTYDNMVLSYESSNLPDSITAYNESNTTIKSTSEGIRYVMLSGTSGNKGEWVEMTFKLNNLTVTELPFSISNQIASDSKGQKITTEVIGAKIIKKNGDVNSDGLVNIKDLIRIKKYFASLLGQAKFSMLNADCNNDNSITSNDMVYLRKSLLGIVTL